MEREITQLSKYFKKENLVEQPVYKSKEKYMQTAQTNAQRFSSGN